MFGMDTACSCEAFRAFFHATTNKPSLACSLESSFMSLWKSVTLTLARRCSRLWMLWPDGFILATDGFHPWSRLPTGPRGPPTRLRAYRWGILGWHLGPSPNYCWTRAGTGRHVNHQILRTVLNIRDGRKRAGAYAFARSAAARDPSCLARA